MSSEVLMAIHQCVAFMSLMSHQKPVLSEEISNPIDRIWFLFLQDGFCCKNRKRSGFCWDLGYGTHRNGKHFFCESFSADKDVIYCFRNRKVSVSVKNVLVRVGLRGCCVVVLGNRSTSVNQSHARVPADFFRVSQIRAVRV